MAAPVRSPEVIDELGLGRGLVFLAGVVLVGVEHDDDLAEGLGQLIEQVGGVEAPVVVEVELGDEAGHLVELDEHLQAELPLLVADHGALRADDLHQLHQEVPQPLEGGDGQLHLEVGLATQGSCGGRDHPVPVVQDAPASR